VKIPGGMQQELESLVRKVSKGTGQVRLLQG
jgi:ribosome maturation protein Sdo1